MDIRKTGKTIAYLRKKKKITQTQLADMIGISDKAVSKWERGLSVPDSSILNRLSIILDSDVATILEGRVGCTTSSWKGLLFLDSVIPASTKVGTETLLSVQLCYFVLAGITKIAVVTNEAEYVKGFVEKFPGLEVTIVNNDKKIVTDYCDGSYVMVIQQPIFLYGVNVTQKFRWAMEKPDGKTVMAVYNPKFSATPLFDEENQELKDYSLLPIFFLKGVDVSEVHKKNFDHLEPIRRGTVSILLDSKQAVSDVCNFMKIMKKQMNIDIYSISDIL